MSVTVFGKKLAVCLFVRIGGMLHSVAREFCSADELGMIKLKRETNSLLQEWEKEPKYRIAE